MKKIYILTAVLALLTLSLNAQLAATPKVAQQVASTREKVDVPFEGIIKASKPAFNWASRATSRAKISTDRAAQTKSVTVNPNGTATNEYLPLLGYYYDYRQQWTQMIYTADQLGDLAVGDVIKSITFYPTTSTLILSGGEIHVYMASTTQSNYDAAFEAVSVDYDNTLVASFTPDPNTDCSNGWTITFDTPFTYDGGNIVIDIDTNIGDTYTNDGEGFYGVETTSYMGFWVNYDSSWNGSRQYFQPKATFTYESTTNPSIAISPEAQTINDAAAGTLTITGTNIEGNINASLANNTDWSLNPTSFSNTGGETSVSYTGRALSASNTVTATAANDNTVTASATVNYVADLFIVTDNGVTNGWDFTNGTNMSYNDGIYTATFTANADNTFILFARMLGNDVNWNTRNVFGPESNGDWWLTGNSGQGNIDLNDDDPIKIVNAGTYTITINSNAGTFTITKQTATPTITYVVNADNVVITATGDGTVTLTVGNQTVSGNGSASITIPRTDVNQTVTAEATAQGTGADVSNPATENITIPALPKTATPTITYVVNDESVTITATGEGTVTLTVDGQTISGDGSASITIPCGMTSSTVTATATAQESGKLVSETATQQIPIPATTGWTQMTGEYNNPNDVLSFTVKEGNDTIDIMMIDQFMVSTLKNDHPDHYTYVMMETINGEDKYSNEVGIPVYKTSSTMQGLYTLEQIKSDKDMHLRANVLNTEMDYDVNPDNNVLYYSLYRGDLVDNPVYPVIDVEHRVSQLQKFEDNTSGTVQYYMFENHQTGITPKYEHLGNEIAERLDTNWVEGQYQDQLPYVPVIWTFGLYSGREDGKNNSYGSDIKRETLGEVTAEAKIYQTTSASGKFKDSNGVEYCIYYPEIKITGVCPVTMTAGDGDVYTYEPYMFRAWCTYEGARDFTSVNHALVDNGPKTTPFMLDSVIVADPSQNIVTIGRDWLPSDTYKLPWAFGVPVTEDPQNVTFIVRFYYRQVVQEGGQQEGGSKLRLGNDAEEFFIAQGAPSSQSAVTAVNELFGGSEVVSVTYYNAQGMQSSKPFKGMNIVVTRYSDGSTSTTKVVR